MPQRVKEIAEVLIKRSANIETKFHLKFMIEISPCCIFFWWYGANMQTLDLLVTVTGKLGHCKSVKKAHYHKPTFVVVTKTFWTVLLLEKALSVFFTPQPSKQDLAILNQRVFGFCFKVGLGPSAKSSVPNFKSTIAPKHYLQD